MGLSLKKGYLLLEEVQPEKSIFDKEGSKQNWLFKTGKRTLYLIPSEYPTIEIENKEYTVATEEDVLAEVTNAD